MAHHHHLSLNREGRWGTTTEVYTDGGSVLGKEGRQRKWCASAAMEPIVGASRTSDSVDY